MANNKLIIAGTIVTLLLGAKQLFSSASKRIEESIRFRIPLDKLSVKTQLLKTDIKAVLEVDNNTYQSVIVENINATINLINANGTKTEIGSTYPDSQKHPIKALSRNIVEIPLITINHANLIFSASTIIDAIKSKQNKIQVIIRGYASGVPFETIQQY